MTSESYMTVISVLTKKRPNRRFGANSLSFFYALLSIRVNLIWHIEVTLRDWIQKRQKTVTECVWRNFGRRPPKTRVDFEAFVWLSHQPENKSLQDKNSSSCLQWNLENIFGSMVARRSASVDRPSTTYGTHCTVSNSQIDTPLIPKLGICSKNTFPDRPPKLPNWALFLVSGCKMGVSPPRYDIPSVQFGDQGGYQFGRWTLYMKWWVVLCWMRHEFLTLVAYISSTRCFPFCVGHSVCKMGWCIPNGCIRSGVQRLSYPFETTIIQECQTCWSFS